MSDGLTLRIIRKTELANVFSQLNASELTPAEIASALEISIILLNSNDDLVHDLGYRLLLKICIKTNNYRPLFDISTKKGYTPIAKMLVYRGLIKEPNRLTYELTSAYQENFLYEATYQTEGQQELFDNFLNSLNEDVVIVAPTSYGKSQLIEEAVRQSTGNVAIIVPSKALISQTRQRISRHIEPRKKRIIIHHDMALDTQTPVIAIVTQERLLRLYQKHPHLGFDIAFVDEAHNLLSADRRARLLASTILISKIRNPAIALKYLTPFLVSPESLSIVSQAWTKKELIISERLKSEDYFLASAKDGWKAHAYDQFLDKIFKLSEKNFSDELSYLTHYAKEKNIAYLNKPADIEKMAHRLAMISEKNYDPELTKLEKEISEFVHPSYKLIGYLKRGIAYHHGSVPDAVRNYIENYFRRSKYIKWIVTNSTLLEGVNIPASALFILDPRKGRRNLSPPQFRNLVGRVNRFSEIFDKDGGHPEKLTPPIHLISGRYCRADLKVENYIRSVAKVDKKMNDEIENPLLEGVPTSEDIIKDRLEDFTFIENIEPSARLRPNQHLAKTLVGRLCFIHNISEIDILTHENSVQTEIDQLNRRAIKLNDAKALMDCIFNIFITKIPEEGSDHEASTLRRLVNEEARLFYSMFFNWRINQVNYRFMISSFISYWSRLIANPAEDAIVFVGKWGDVIRDGHTANHVDLRAKGQEELINLAIVRIKEEQDFIDNRLVKFLEILYDLELVDVELYNKIKYGTTNRDQIALIRSGLSHIAAHILVTHYRRYVNISNDGIVTINPSILAQFEKRREKEIVRAEIEASGLLYS